MKTRLSPVWIVKATPKDIPVMWAWGENHWELWNSKTCKWYSRASLRRLFADPRHDIIFLAKAGIVPAGMCLVHTIRDFAYCTGLYVEKEYRGNGIATMLVRRMIAELRRKKVNELFLSVNAKNACAVSLFRNLGFKKGYPSISLGMQLRKVK